jgi:putative ABC transport system permease protein
MWKVTLAGVRGHVLRLLLTCLAVTLGTAFVAGSLVLTDSLDRTFSAIFSTAESTDAVVRLPEDDDEAPAGPELPGLQIGLAADIQALDGIDRAVPQLTGSALLQGADRTAVRSGGAPSLGFAWDPDDPAVRLLDGRGVEAVDEVVVEEATLERSGLAIGDETVVIVNGTPYDVTIVGEATNDLPTAGASIVLVESGLARAQFAPTGVVQSITVTGVEGSTQEQVVATVAPLVPDGAEVITGQQQADETQETLQEALGFVTTFLLVFAGVALFVGAFIIFNTFTMLVAQRTRELALLRAVGASRGQVVRSVLAEAVLVGLAGAATGLGLGVGLAAALQALVASLFGLQLDGLPVQPRTVVATFVVGVVVTAVAAVLPARRASATAPVAAMRDDQALPSTTVRARAAAGLLLAVAGAAAMALVLTDRVTQNALPVLGAGVAAVFLGIAIASPAVSKPVVWLLTAPLARTAVGRLAQRNGLRNPRRTAATASALMIGVALVGAVSVLSSSATASVADIVENELEGELVVSDGGPPTIPVGVADQVARVDGVAAVLALPFTPAQLDGDDALAMTVDPETLPDLVALTVLEGSLDELGEGVWLSESAAEELGADVGDSVLVRVGTGESADREVLAVHEDSQLVASDVLVSADVHAAGTADLQAPDGSGGVQYVVVDVADGSDVAAVRERVTDVAAQYLTLSVLDAEEFTGEQTAQINTVLGLLYALLGLSLVIAMLGVVNTLALSVVERTREIGLLRAIGLTRPQLRRTMTIESVATTVFGALLGVSLGLAFGVALQQQLVDDGLEVLSVPWPTVVAVLVGSAVVGVFAAVLPAWRATRIDMLRAITTD